MESRYNIGDRVYVETHRVLGTVVGFEGKYVEIEDDDGARYRSEFAIYEPIINVEDIPAGNKSFRNAMIALWKNKLIFRKVKTTTKKGVERISDKSVHYGPNMYFPDMKTALAKADPSKHKFLVKEYKSFYGFTTATKLYDNDNIDSEIYFNKKSAGRFRSVLYKSSRKYKLWKDFPSANLEHSYKSICPLNGQIICGTPAQTEDGRWKFNRWFIASPQFIKLYEMIMYPKKKIKFPLTNGMKKALSQPYENKFARAFYKEVVMGEELTEAMLGDVYENLLRLCYDKSYVEQIQHRLNLVHEHEKTCRICHPYNTICPYSELPEYDEHVAIIKNGDTDYIYERAMKMVYGK